MATKRRPPGDHRCKRGQGCGSSDRFRNQPQLPFILFTTPKTARDFPTQNDSEFIIVSLTGRPHYKSRVVFRTVFSENHGHHAGIADFFLLVSCFSMLPLIFLCHLFTFHVMFPPHQSDCRGSSYFKRNRPPDPSHTDPPLSFSIFAVSHCKFMAAQR